MRLSQQTRASQRGITTSNRRRSIALITARDTACGVTANDGGDFGGTFANDRLKSVFTGPGDTTET